MNLRKNKVVALMAGLALVAGACAPEDADQADDPAPGTQQSPASEVWLVDQSNCEGQSHGGAIQIFDGADLEGPDASSAEPTDVIDLCAETTDMALAETGSEPVRPHMILFNSTASRAVLSFVVSGHVVIFDTETRMPVAALQASEGAGGARQAHAAFPAPDDSYILVANQNGKLLERIDSDFVSDTYTLNGEATLDLAACTTPNDENCEDETLRPDNAPICPIIDDSSDLGFVTLRGGGMFVVDAKATPMAILAEYDRSVVNGNGCGGLQAGDSMFINSGGGTPANLHGFDVYRFPVSGYEASNAQNTPAPEVVFSDDAGERDSHGMILTADASYLWVLDRAGNAAEVFDVDTGERVNTVTLESSDSDNPTPDLGVLSPNGNRIYLSMRGPNPLSGDHHVATGAVPGLGVVEVDQDGRSGELIAVIPITNPDPAGDEQADSHGIAIRLK